MSDKDLELETSPDAIRERDIDADLHHDHLVGSGLGKPGAHKVETGVGAVVGAMAAGAAGGTAAGPVGTVIGAVVGAVAGGIAGKGVAETVNPTEEDAYWRENYSTRPYVSKEATYDDYAPAYRYGVDTFGRFDRYTFEQSEPELRRGWTDARGSSRLSWEDARHATRDSWERLGSRRDRELKGGE